MSVREDYGQRRVHVTAEVFEAWLVNENRVTTDLPDDARFVRLYPREKGDYFLVFESREWDELKEGESIPQIEVTAERPNSRVTIQK
jgi:hypothetical protein